MANFVLRLLKRKGASKSKRRSSRKANDSSDSDNDDDGEGVIESKFDYDEGVMTSRQTITGVSYEELEVRCFCIRRLYLLLKVEF